MNAERLDGDGAERLRSLLLRHHAYTGSTRAAALLASWPTAVTQFRIVRPCAEVGRLEAAAEGTAHDEPVAA